MKSVVRTAALTALGCLAATAASADVRRFGPVTVFTAASPAAQPPASIDFANAREMPLPAARALPPSQAEALQQGSALRRGRPGSSPGDSGSGEESPIQLAAPLNPQIQQVQPQGQRIEPAEFGTSNHPFTTARVHAELNKTSKFYPYRAAGKLFFNDGGGTFVCSAALIKPGIVVTAAHCVAAFGQSRYYTNWTFVPAYNNGLAPYGSWTASNAYVLTSYFNGADSCAQAGVVCQNDVAVLVQNPQSGQYPGGSTGFFGYGFDGFGFNDQNQVLVNQLGYPVALDSGELMQRNDSQGFVDPISANNTIIGSLMTGGSSGGPWLVNLGIAPQLLPPLQGGTKFGQDATRNTVVGVTSWGYGGLSGYKVKQMGASPFTSANIVFLVNTACSQVPAACQ